MTSLVRNSRAAKKAFWGKPKVGQLLKLLVYAYFKSFKSLKGGRRNLLLKGRLDYNIDSSFIKASGKKDATTQWFCL